MRIGSIRKLLKSDASYVNIPPNFNQSTSYGANVTRKIDTGLHAGIIRVMPEEATTQECLIPGKVFIPQANRKRDPENRIRPSLPAVQYHIPEVSTYHRSITFKIQNLWKQ
jgi:hypothetical protein